MTVLNILIYPDSKLTEVASVVTEFDDELRALTENMTETMYAYNGLGLAAPQVGVSQRVFVMDVQEGKDLFVLVNPVIESFSSDVSSISEGCLSFPGYFEKVVRSSLVTGTAQDVEGVPIHFEFTGLAAQCVAHEVEHLDGHVLTDNIGRAKRRWIIKDLKKRKKKRHLRYATPG